MTALRDDWILSVSGQKSKSQFDVLAQMRRCVGPKRVAYAVLLCVCVWMGGEYVQNLTFQRTGTGLESSQPEFRL